jgi:hypothetical protein
MLTKKILQLKGDLLISNSDNPIEWNEFWRELITNCNPTKEEFCVLASGAVYTTEALWNFMNKPEKWNHV